MKRTDITLALSAVLMGTPAAAAIAQPASGQHGNWQGTVGVAAASLGSYYGSDARRTLGAPLVGLVYRQRLLIGSSSTSGLGGGVEYLVSRGAIGASLGLSGVEPRPEEQADVLAGMDDRHGAVFATATLSLRAGPAAAASTTLLGLGRNAGVMQMLGLQLGGMFTSRLGASIGGVATFANATNMAFDFGITPGQADRRRELLDAGDGRLRVGDATPFAPEGGLKETRGTIQATYVLRGAWRAIGVLSAGRLSREGAESPLARKRNALTVATGVAYAF
jgi:outer membrane scaffolding protein for murein synthesis (MipA/OmpV family)